MSASGTDRSRRRITLRADASASIGLGHAMRTLTLGQALAVERCDVRFVARGVPHTVLHQFENYVEAINCVDVRGDEKDARTLLAGEPDLVVVDGYHFSSKFFETLERANTPYVVIDDNVETTARAPTIIVNQNPHATAELYSRMVSNPLLLLGLRYALIRPEILATKRMNLQREPGTVLVSLGGSDPRNLTIPIVERLAGTGARLAVAIGPAHPGRAAVVTKLHSVAPSAVVVAADDYVARLATSEVAILGAGTSLWEAACLGTPSIAVVVAENQRLSARAAVDSGLAVEVHEIGERHIEDLANDIARRALGYFGIDAFRRDIVDGTGAARVADALQTFLR